MTMKFSIYNLINHARPLKKHKRKDATVRSLTASKSTVIALNWALFAPKIVLVSIALIIKLQTHI